MSAMAEGLQTIQGRDGIVLPDVKFEDLRYYDPAYKILNLFRLTAVANEWIEPYDNNRHQEPGNFEYEFVLPATDTDGLVVVSGFRKQQTELEKAQTKAASPKFSSSRSRGYLFAREEHAVKVPPANPGSFVTRISLKYNQHEGGWSMGGANVPSDAPTVMLDEEYIFVNDSNAEERCRATYTAFYEILGEER